ncbi:unnamed protein product, partial [Musa hybrid cultivar]
HISGGVVNSISDRLRGLRRRRSRDPWRRWGFGWELLVEEGDLSSPSFLLSFLSILFRRLLVSFFATYREEGRSIQARKKESFVTHLLFSCSCGQSLVSVFVHSWFLFEIEREGRSIRTPKKEPYVPHLLFSCSCGQSLVSVFVLSWFLFEIERERRSIRARKKEPYVPHLSCSCG